MHSLRCRNLNRAYPCRLYGHVPQRRAAVPRIPQHGYARVPAVRPSGTTSRKKQSVGIPPDSQKSMEERRKTITDLASKEASQIFYPSKHAEKLVRKATREHLEGKTETDLLEEKYATKITPKQLKEMERFSTTFVEILKAPIYNPVEKLGPPEAPFTADLDTYFERYSRTTENYCKFISGWARAGNMTAARNAVQEMKELGIPRDAKVYDGLLVGYAKLGDPDSALQVLEEMKQDNVQPTTHNFTNIINACIEAKQLDRAYDCYQMLIDHDLKPDVAVFTSLIKGCAHIEADYERAWATFDHMRVWHCQPDTIVYDLMISIAAKEQKAERAMTLLDDMRADGLRPTEYTFNSLIEACAKRPDCYRDMFDYLQKMKNEGFAPNNVTLINLLLGASISGDAETAELIFDQIKPENEYEILTTHTLMMKAYGMANRVDFSKSNEHIQKGENIFKMLLDKGVKPDVKALEARLFLYTSAFRLNTALQIKESFKEYGVKPTTDAYNHLIHMFGYTRRVERAFDMFNLMKQEEIPPNKTTYVQLITACIRSKYFQSGMKVIREMKEVGFQPSPFAGYIKNFRRLLTRHPHYVRELDEITGKAGQFVLPWNKPGPLHKRITYRRDLTEEEKKRSPLYG